MKELSIRALLCTVADIKKTVKGLKNQDSIDESYTILQDALGKMIVMETNNGNRKKINSST